MWTIQLALNHWAKLNCCCLYRSPVTVGSHHSWKRTAPCLALGAVYSSTCTNSRHYWNFVQVLRGHNVICLQFQSLQIPGFTGQERLHVHRIFFVFLVWFFFLHILMFIFRKIRVNSQKVRISASCFLSHIDFTLNSKRGTQQDLDLSVLSEVLDLLGNLFGLISHCSAA